MAEVNGALVVARALRQQGVDAVFGVVGHPVTGVAQAAQREGIRYYGMRHEQAAAYAAQAYSYLTGRVAAALVVSGPGMTNAISGLANAWANCWPMLLLGGSSDLALRGRGDFQEAPQVEAARPWCKWAGQAERVEQIPRFVADAVRSALYGRPGPTYLDLPGDVLSGTAEEERVAYPARVLDPPRPLADPEAVRAALDALRTAERPLVIVGKGAAWSRAEREVREFVEATGLPYLPAPMAKGLIPDDHPQSAASARSYALQHADLVFLIGARLNWIMHFGLPPRFAPDVRVVQLDISADEIGTNVPAEVALAGDARAVMGQLLAALRERPWQLGESPWLRALAEEKERNRQQVEPMLQDDSVPMGYYRVLREIDEALPRDAIVVSEGSNTMDIGRAVLNNYLPRHRLDAGTFGTMGVGPGFAIAAQAAHPDKRVVAVEGDSAFGFDGMEVEVAARYGMPITFVVVNNNGIGVGVERLDPERPVPPGALLPGARYEKVMEAFGGLGFYAETPDQLRAALREALAAERPSLINVPINPRARRKPQPFPWLTR
ncbi:MAG TPA: oxalyl-CoA decarboxylase [Dehalococcoidia bacterium]